MPNLPLSMNYATHRFGCLQGECPDTCCTGFRVGLSDEEYGRLEVTLASHPATASRGALVKLRRAHSVSPDAPGADATFAQQDGACVLLDDDGLCAIHRNFGEKELVTVCSLYPRTVASVGDSLEVFLTLACPEAARLVLIDDDAFEIVEAKEAEEALEAHRRGAHRVLEDQRNTVFRAHHKKIEALTLSLESNAQNLREVLFFLAVFADAIEEAAEISEENLKSTLDDFSESDVVDSLRQTHNLLPTELTDGAPLKAARLATDLFAARLGQGPHPRFAARANHALFTSPANQEQILAWFTDRPPTGVAMDDVVALLARSEIASDDVALGRKDHLLRAMVRHSLKTEWWIRATSPRHRATVLMTRVLLVNLLVANDSRLDLRSPSPPAFSKQDLDDAVVEAVQLIAKSVTHVPTFARLVELALEEHGHVDLAGSLALLPP